MELYRENREEPDDNSSYSYPTTLLRFIDRKEMFNRNYNRNFRRRHTDPVVSKHDCTRRFTVEPSMREELCRIFRREKDLLENTKISRLDYLAILLFILNSGLYSEGLLDKLRQFLQQHAEALDGSKSLKLTQFL